MGDLPLKTPADWAPGKGAPDVYVNPGTYWVFGIAKADNGDKYYQILVSCQLLYVPIDAMQPSYQSPWNGQPLPSTEVK